MENHFDLNQDNDKSSILIEPGISK